MHALEPVNIQALLYSIFIGVDLPKHSDGPTFTLFPFFLLFFPLSSYSFSSLHCPIQLCSELQSTKSSFEIFLSNFRVGPTH